MKRFVSRQLLAHLLVSASLLCMICACSKEKTRTVDSDSPASETGGAPKTKITKTNVRESKPAAPTKAAAAKTAKPKPVEDEDNGSTEPRLLLTGKVTLEGGGPAAGATVKLNKPNFTSMNLEQSPTTSTETDSDGHYTIRTADSQYFMMSASKAGYATRTVGVYDERAMGPGAKQVGLRKQTVDVVLAPSAKVSGRVEDENGKPLPAITVQAVSIPKEQNGRIMPSTAMTSTTAEGTFTFEEVAAGEISLSVDSKDYVQAMQTITAPADGVVFRLMKDGATVEGSVAMLGSESAVADSTVTVMLMPENQRNYFGGRSRTVQSDKDGAFKIEKLAKGKYNITAQKDDLFPITRSQSPGRMGGNFMFELAEKETTNGVRLYLYPGHTISGKITEKEGGAPVAGVKVSFTGYGRGKPSTQTSESGADGTYKLEKVSSNYGYNSSMGVRLEVEKKGYSVFVRNQNQAYNANFVALSADKLEATKDIQLVKAITVSGTVETEGGKPVAGAKVQIVNPRFGRDEKGVSTDAKGAYEVDVAPFTSIRVKASGGGFPSAVSEVVEVIDKSITDVKIVLKPGGTLSGTVVGPDGGPISGADVSGSVSYMVGQYGSGDTVGSVKSGTQGEFTLLNVPNGQVYLSASKKGYSRTQNENINVTPNSTKTGIKLQLGTAHHIAGKVTNAKGEPIVGANVNAWDNRGGGSGNTTTDKDGKYKVEDLGPGACQVNVYAMSYNSENKQNVAVDRDDVDFVLKTAGAPDGSRAEVTLIGKIVDSRNNQPIEDFTVSSDYTQSIEKDSSQKGVFIAKGLTGGNSVRFHFEATGYVTMDTPYVQVPMGKPTFEQTFKMGPGGSLIGRVVDKGSKAPLAGVTILVRGNATNEYDARNNSPTDKAQTADDGKFSFKGLPSGQTFLSFRAPSTPSEFTRSFTITDEKETDAGDVELLISGVIKGKLTRDPGEDPVAGATITLRPNQGGTQKDTTTDNQGAYSFSGLSNGDYSISVPEYKLNGYANLNDKSEAEVNLKIGAASLIATVMKRGVPEVGAQFNLSRATGNFYVQTDSSGKAEFKNLAAGKYNYNIYANSGGGYNRGTNGEIEIAAGEQVEKTITLPSSAIFGKILDENNNGVAGANVTLGKSRDAGNDMPSFYNTTIQSSGDGTFRFDGLGPGAYSVTATKSGVGNAVANSVAVPADGDAPEVVLKLTNTGGTLISTALNLSNGQPIPEAWCTMSTNGGQFQHNSTRDANGKMTIENIPPGQYQVEVSSWGFSINRHDVTIEEKKTVTLDDVLYDAGALNWTLKDKGGAPLKNVPCKLVPSDPGSIEKERSGQTNSSGTWTARGLFPGMYNATATPPDKSPVNIQIKIEAHQPTQQTTTVE
ncbi:MAG: carboxypeptidase regulatory-like domain-containing protein [Candidatus Sumerlaeaceae bacterium]|nr:carboxypeptidase regulatory-like domain-containing protein [Candidatus Sumerlaeaceae bacterium]